MVNNDDFVTIFEKRLCDFTGAPFAVAVDSCTNAILLSVVASSINNTISVPKNTYLSVPMTLINNQYDVVFHPENWVGSYEVTNNIYDCAVGLKKNMYKKGHIECLSFQQKKRLPIGKGGAILTDDEELANKLRRLRHDGRDSSVPVKDDDPNKITMGYHMYMSPDQAAKGILLINQIAPYVESGWYDYPNISNLKCFTH